MNYYSLIILLIIGLSAIAEGYSFFDIFKKEWNSFKVYLFNYLFYAL